MHFIVSDSCGGYTLWLEKVVAVCNLLLVIVVAVCTLSVIVVAVTLYG